jgi:hypothetical protein
MTISVEYACRNAANHPTNLLGHVSWRVQFSDAEGVDGLITVCPVCGREPKEWHYRFPPPPESVSEPQSEPQSGRVSVQIHDERYDFDLGAANNPSLAQDYDVIIGDVNHLKRER